jgi:hypothetical protein
LPHDYPKKGGFPMTIAPYQPNAFTPVYPEADVIKQQSVAKTLGQVINADHGRIVSKQNK